MIKVTTEFKAIQTEEQFLNDMDLWKDNIEKDYRGKFSYSKSGNYIKMMIELPDGTWPAHVVNTFYDFETKYINIEYNR